MMWVWALVGCELAEIRNQLEGLTTPLVMEGLMLGIAEPMDERIDLSGLDRYDPGANLTIFLADASNANELDNALVSGAMVTASVGAGDVDVPEQQDGLYAVLPPTDLEYEPMQTLDVEAVLSNRTGTGQLELPEGAGLSAFEAHPVDTPLPIDVSGRGYTGTLIVVIDTTTGDVTYSNEPEGAREIYDLTRGRTEVTSVTVPAEAFPAESVYALGFAGLVHTRSEDFDGFNTLLSGILAGQLQFQPVVTVPLP
ncbi:MAG: hypothetical protein AAF602_03770 [Myxococcota bacterium]